MLKGEITESESSVQILISKQNSPTVYFFFSLLNWLSYTREDGTETRGWWERGKIGEALK